MKYKIGKSGVIYHIWATTLRCLKHTTGMGLVSLRDFVLISFSFFFTYNVG